MRDKFNPDIGREDREKADSAHNLFNEKIRGS